MWDYWDWEWDINLHKPVHDSIDPSLSLAKDKTIVFWGLVVLKARATDVCVCVCVCAWFNYVHMLLLISMRFRGSCDHDYNEAGGRGVVTVTVRKQNGIYGTTNDDRSRWESYLFFPSFEDNGKGSVPKYFLLVIIEISDAVHFTTRCHSFTFKKKMYPVFIPDDSNHKDSGIHHQNASAFHHKDLWTRQDILHSQSSEAQSWSMHMFPNEFKKNNTRLLSIADQCTEWKTQAVLSHVESHFLPPDYVWVLAYKCSYSHEQIKSSLLGSCFRGQLKEYCLFIN